NWTYAIPNGSQFVRNVVGKVALDGWQLSSFANIRSGSAPLGGISYSVTGLPAGLNLSGSPTTGIARIQVIDLANIFTAPKNNLDSGLNSAAFAIPAVATRGLGNAPPVLFWGPGSWNFDFTLFKTFLLSKDKPRTLEFRIETYNTFNHPNYGN